MKKIILGIDGMRCGMCEAHINDAVRKCMGDKIIKIKSSHKKNTCQILSDDSIDLDDLKDSITKDGYRITSRDVIENYTKRGLFW